MMRWAAILFYLVVGGMVWGVLGELSLAGGGLTIMLLMAASAPLERWCMSSVTPSRRCGSAAASSPLCCGFDELGFRSDRVGPGAAPQASGPCRLRALRAAAGDEVARGLLGLGGGAARQFRVRTRGIAAGAAALAAWLGATGLPAPQSHTGLLPSDAGVLASIRHDHYLWAAKASQLLAIRDG